MSVSIETIVIGAGQAGLSIGACLTQLGREQLVLEQAGRPAHVWSEERWDSFCLVTPNWTVRLPGAPYQGVDLHGYMSRAELATYFEDYAARFADSVRYNTRVQSVERGEDGSYRVQTEQDSFLARNVVVATGLFQTPKVLPAAANLPAGILQLSSARYRNPAQLPPGAVLVVGSAQSGCQIVEDLHLSGRKVYLCTGSAGRIPRHYRGKDIVWWSYETQFFHRTPDVLPSPAARFAATPHLTGRGGGHTINLHLFARNGVTLLGRLEGIRDGRLFLSQNLHENLAKADDFEVEFVKRIDDHISKNGLDAQAEELPCLRDGFAQHEVRELDLKAAGITSVIWALGHRFDFSLVRLPAVDEYGYPVQQRGVSAYPGLYFLGLPWLRDMKSGLLMGVGEDAQFLAEHIAASDAKMHPKRARRQRQVKA